MNTYLESNASPESFANYLGTYVYGTKDHQEFIERAGGKKVIGKLKW